MAVTCVPFINQTPYWLVLPSCQRMSDRPSPLKSPVLIIDQPREGEPMLTSAVAVEPFINQMPTCPVLVSRQRKSCLPFPSKSGELGIVTMVEAAGLALRDWTRLAIFGTPSPVQRS